MQATNKLSWAEARKRAEAAYNDLKDKTGEASWLLRGKEQHISLRLLVGFS